MPNETTKPAEKPEKETKLVKAPVKNDAYDEPNVIQRSMTQNGRTTKTIEQMTKDHTNIAKNLSIVGMQLKENFTRKAFELGSAQSNFNEAMTALNKNEAQFKEFLHEMQDFYHIQGKFGIKWGINADTGEIVSLVPDDPEKKTSAGPSSPHGDTAK